jgi:integrase/recombinase XerD
MVRELKQETYTIEEAKKNFLIDCSIRNLSERTIQWYDDTLRLVFENIIANTNKKYINEITAKDIKQHIKYCQDKGLKSNTINNRIRALKAFFGFLEREDIIKKNIMKKISKLKFKQQIIKTFSEQQINQLLKQPDKNTFSGLRDYTLILLLLDTGLRISEALNLKIKDINLETGTIFVSRGKGDKERTVPMGSFLRKALVEYMKHISDLELDDYIFITVHDNQLDRHRFGERLKNYGDKAGIENIRVSPHTFRHTFAVNYLRNGGNIYYLQSILGHTTLDMVKKYLQSINDDVINAHSKFSPLDNIKKKRK